MLIAGLPDAETAGRIATLMFSLTLVFNGVFQPPTALPGFWSMLPSPMFSPPSHLYVLTDTVFMYRVSPLTYLVDGIVATGLHNRVVICATNELAIMQPPSGETCGSYLSQYASLAHGAIYNPNATSDCQYCAATLADEYLAGNSIFWDQRWRNWGLGFAYIGFNIAVAVLLYYLIRVRKGSGRTMGERFQSLLGLFKRDSKGKKGAEKATTETAAPLAT
jgi:ATP-binding cassette subfamily G (WHITE) protein 2 (PDR)